MREPRSGRVPRRYGDVAELLAGATERSLFAEAPGKSGARLERVVIGGQRYMLKHLDLAEDWTMRASGSLRGAPLALWERGILARLPDCFNQPIVGVAPEERAGPAPAGGCALLMRDVTSWLVPVTDAPITLRQHARFLQHMAALHASFWDCGSEFDVVPAMHRYLELSPWMAQAEAAMNTAHLVPQLVAKGWPLLAEVAPAIAAVVTPLAHDPGPLVEALASTPHTFVHSNWKLDNLGTDDAGRTVILDWEQPGHGAAISDLAWYLAINCRRLPQSKETSIGFTVTRLRHAASIQSPGGSVSWRCPCWAPWSSSGGRRRSAAMTRNSDGGRPRRWRRQRCSTDL